MAYVGQGIKNGTFSVLDTSGNTYNGSNVTFNLGTQVSSPAQLLVSHDGVIQKPGTDYTIATGGTQITFTTAPASGASIFITEISGAVGAPMNRDINGDELILDADADTSITADTDDQIDIKVGGTDVVTLTNSSLVLKGTTPTITIGDAGAEDTKIVFDGNAVDYHIGLDDSADDLIIGKGSALGTTTSVAIDENGIVRLPLQSCFLVHPSSEQANPTNNTTVAFGTERFDLNGDFASNTFTAPVAGKYQLNVVITTNNIDNAATLMEWTVITSNHTYRPLGNVPDKLFSSDTGDHQHFAASLIADMDASDTAHVQFYQTGGTAQVDIITLSYFSGVLVAG